MTLSAVQAGAYLHHLALESADPEGLAGFYGRAMDMAVRRAGTHEWRAEGPRRRIVALRGESRRLAYAGFACNGAEGLAALRARATEAGLPVLDSPSPYFADGAFAVRDPNGNTICFGLARAPETPRQGMHGPIQHLTLASQRVEATYEFFCNKLGFTLTDRVLDDAGGLKTFFCTSSHEHHTIACFETSVTGIDHHCYEVGRWELIRDYCDRWAELDIPVIWGPGRHGPGNNLFAFIEDPDGNKVEISAELEVIQDREPGVWPMREKTLNQWGKAIIRT